MKKVALLLVGILILTLSAGCTKEPEAVRDPEYDDPFTVSTVHKDSISADSDTAALTAAGTVMMAGSATSGGKAYRKLTNVVSISTSPNYLAALKDDGTVEAVAMGLASVEAERMFSQIAEWTDMADVAISDSAAFGLKKDGKVVTASTKEDRVCKGIDNWAKIIDVDAGDKYVAGVREDGTVRICTWEKELDLCKDWTDVTAISVSSHVVGLKSDGTVVAVGENAYGQCDVSGWTDIVAVRAGSLHTVGLKADGTVVATGKNDDGQCNVSDWTNVVSIAAGRTHTAAILSDGTAVAVGKNSFGQCDVGNWKDLNKN